MSRHERVEALVLSRRNSGEADRLVTFFTRQRGLTRVVAKGVRRIPSRRGGHLEPMTCVVATLAGSHERSYLVTVETSDYLSELHRDSEALMAAHLLGSVAAQLFEYGTAYPFVYEAVRYAWENLTRFEDGRRHLLEAAVVTVMLREAGVMPGLGELAEAGVSFSERAQALWRHICAEPGQVVKLPVTEGGSEVARALRQYLRHTLPLRLMPLAVH